MAIERTLYFWRPKFGSYRHYVLRKRPTQALQGDIGVEAGSWDHLRLDRDLSGPLNASGSLRARVVATGEQENSYLDYYKHKRGLVYGVVA